MSKSIYEEALGLTEIKIDNENMYVKDKKIYHATFDLEVIELINNALQQAEKQEKLLELYKELTLILNDLIIKDLSELVLSGGYYKQKILKIKNKIKELENE